MAFVTIWPHANRRAVKITPGPPQKAMQQSQIVRLRVDRRQVTTWQRVAKRRGENLSEFIRAATHAACAELVTSDDWKARLIDVRSRINLALRLRTDEQKNQRTEAALDVLNRAIEVLDAR